MDDNSLLMPNRARTFAWAAQFLPHQTRADLGVLYSFCRYVDDGVDHCYQKEIAENFLDSISRALETNYSENKQVADFLCLSAKRNIPLGFASDLVGGVRKDIKLEQMGSLEELLRYSYQVAGTVGIMICYLLEVTTTEALASAIDLGIAMQLTNIARDILEDFNQGRIYLPKNLIARSAVTNAIAGDPASRTRVVEVLNELLNLAQTYYRSSDSGICFLPSETKLSILCASRGYNQIGKLIAKNPQLVFTERVSTSRSEKALCFCTCLFSLTLPRYYRINAHPAHASELHLALRGLPSFDVVYQ